jgi:hypothetical protein
MYVIRTARGGLNELDKMEQRENRNDDESPENTSDPEDPYVENDNTALIKRISERFLRGPRTKRL